MCGEEIKVRFKSKEIKREKVETLDKLTENFNESTEFYKLVKYHANISFWVSIIAMITGVVFYALGLYYVVKLEKDVIILSTVAGSFVELVAGTVFILHNRCLKEMNEFHKRLSSTERYLTSIMLAEKMSEGKRDEQYEWILQNCILTDVEIQTGTIFKWRHERDNVKI